MVPARNWYLIQIWISTETPTTGMWNCLHIIAALGSLVVVCLPLDTRLVGSNPADNGFLRVIEIGSMTSEEK
jgi:hypothetical protein